MCWYLPSHMATLCTCVSTQVCVDRISSAFSIYCPNKSQWRETGGMDRARKRRRKRYACMTPWFMWRRKRAREGEIDRNEWRHNSLSTRHHFIFFIHLVCVVAHTAELFSAVTEQEVCKTITYLNTNNMNQRRKYVRSVFRTA